MQELIENIAQHINLTTLILASVGILLSVITPLLNPFFRKIKLSESLNATPDPTSPNTQTQDAEQTETLHHEAISAQADLATEHNTQQIDPAQDSTQQPEAQQVPTTQPCEMPAVSIILTPNNEAQALSNYLPKLLAQDYPQFQIVVVAPKGDLETEDVLKKYADNPQLYITFIPESSRYMSRKKLAITLGVKAAKHQWLLITDPTAQPTSNQWLKAMARHAQAHTNLVVGYAKYEEDTPEFWRFKQIHTAQYLINEYCRSNGHRCVSNVLMFRKADFEAHEGYRGNLKYIRGEYDFIVNNYAQKGRLAFENSPEGTLIALCPTEKEWLNQHLFYFAIRNQLKGSYAHRLRYTLDQIALHANYLYIIALYIYGSLTFNFLLLLGATIALITTLSIRIAIAQKRLRKLEEEISLWKIIPYEIRIAYNYFNYRIKYWKADKFDFISHKL